MPTYEYQCKECGYEFSRILKIADMRKPEYDNCPNCDKQNSIKKKLSTPMIVGEIGGTLGKTDEGWKDRLREIKKAHPLGNVNV